MDTFNRVIKELAQMTDVNKMDAIESKRRICICQRCLQYSHRARESDELLYCLLGQSLFMVIKENGCLCSECQVPQQIGLKYMFFCKKGSEQEQREK